MSCCAARAHPCRAVETPKKFCRVNLRERTELKDANRMNSTEPTHGSNTPAQPKTIFIVCAALGREVRAIIKKHGWNADFEAIDAKLHLRPQKIGPAVQERLEKNAGKYERRVVVYGHCGAFDLDDILEEHGAVRPLGPHCYEMYGGEHFAQALSEVAGTYILTDFLVRAWETLAVQGLKLDKHPQLKDLMFHNYRKVIYYSQEEDAELVAKAYEIAAWLNLPLTVEHVGYGDLERRLVAIMEDRDQPTTAMTLDGYTSTYPIAGNG